MDNNIKMKPGRKGVQVSSPSSPPSSPPSPPPSSPPPPPPSSPPSIRNLPLFQVLSSLAASLGQAAVGHCFPLSAYVIPQVPQSFPHWSHLTPYSVQDLLVIKLLSWRKTQATR